ncbi:hypothetical protein [Herbiconiux sp. YIM B11900]|uniref:hypothetical protein n=1 Tax=Herbiconiux sp. YIM B11900 TaxID=3404131 RepID=UPI003F875383
MGDFSLLPSLVVFAGVIAALVVGATLLRRRSRRLGRPVPGRLSRDPAAPAPGGGAPVRLPVDELVKRASIQLVQMDDALREAADEIEFTRAEFGDAAATEFAEALDTARRRASEAFALRQRLDDSVPDTEQQQRDWSKRILSLSDSALALVTAQSRSIQDRRRDETSAPAALARARSAIVAGRARLPESRATLSELADAYASTAIAPVTDAAAEAEAAFDAADAELTGLEQSLAANALAPVARPVQQAESAVRRALARLDGVERMRQGLREARVARESALSAAGAQRTEAARLRDTVEDAAAAERITAASAALEAAVDTARARTAADPVADVDALAAAAAHLDETLAVARTAQQRLDSARSALVGAIAIAESHIRTADDAIASGRGRVGTDARTRLAAARHELELARQEADPVAALDGARRAATRATDADALARYDLQGLGR